MGVGFTLALFILGAVRVQEQVRPAADNCLMAPTRGVRRHCIVRQAPHGDQSRFAQNLAPRVVAVLHALGAVDRGLSAPGKPRGQNHVVVEIGVLLPRCRRLNDVCTAYVACRRQRIALLRGRLCTPSGQLELLTS